MAETEAEAALRMGEVPVGCVFVRGGAVVARCEMLDRSGKISSVTAFRHGTNPWILLLIVSVVAVCPLLCSSRCWAARDVLLGLGAGGTI